jgi:hypothetical protein
MQKTRNNSLILTFAALLAMILSSVNASAQELDSELDLELDLEQEIEVEVELVAPEGFEFADSLIYVRVHDVDSTYLGVDVLNMNVAQSDALAGSLLSHIEANPERAISGYRVRIFFDNKQSARAESEKILRKFESMFHDVYAYRTYANPYFKVTVGDCRTKSEAMALLGRIKKVFPSAFVVKENIMFPPSDKSNLYRPDTIQVLHPVLPQN